MTADGRDLTLAEEDEGAAHPARFARNSCLPRSPTPSTRNALSEEIRRDFGLSTPQPPAKPTLKGKAIAGARSVQDERLPSKHGRRPWSRWMGSGRDQGCGPRVTKWHPNSILTPVTPMVRWPYFHIGNPDAQEAPLDDDRAPPLARAGGSSGGWQANGEKVERARADEGRGIMQDEGERQGYLSLRDGGTSLSSLTTIKPRWKAVADVSAPQHRALRVSPQCARGLDKSLATTSNEARESGRKLSANGEEEKERRTKPREAVAEEERRRFVEAFSRLMMTHVRDGLAACDWLRRARTGSGDLTSTVALGEEFEGRARCKRSYTWRIVGLKEVKPAVRARYEVY
ncbi:hypothetical protein B0H13DRAFT_1892292 [Mycena leptocephala]|nr:hypothetical protein B0H13DRAFT_1892292 [Mycena leptocephala]